MPSWDRVREGSGDGWCLLAVGEEPPGEPADAARIETFVTEMDKLLRREHQEDYCGIVYADDLQAPGFIKIYDPNNLVVSCGYSDNPPLPGLDHEPDSTHRFAGGPSACQGSLALMATALFLSVYPKFRCFSIR